MGLKCSPDYSQEVMENIFRDITNAEVYIDDIGAFSHSWDDHLQLLRSILTKLQDIGFTVNSLTPKSVLAGTKNSRSEDFLLAKHKHTNIPTMMEPFAPPAAWDLWILPIVRANPLPKGSGGGVVEGI